MKTKSQPVDREITQIYEVLKSEFPHLSDNVNDVVRRYNSISIRVRLIDDQFQGKSLSERDQIAMKALARLPEKVERNITMLLTLTPQEVERGDNLMDVEFRHPNKSNL